MKEKRVRFTSDARGSIDGITVVEFKEGDVKTLPVSLADAFTKHMKVAVGVRGKAKDKAIEEEVTDESNEELV